MILDRFTTRQLFTIWQPRWKDRKVLLASYKVGTHNEILFTKAPSLGEEPYYVSGKVVREYPLETNGKISCYAVPIDKLEILEVS